MAPRPLIPQFLTWAVDGFVLVTVFIVYLLFEKWIEPFHRGFFCDDDSILYPLKPNTISTGVAIAIGVTVVLATILGVHLFSHRGSKCERNVFKPCFEDVFIYIFGGVCSQTTCNIIKIMAGRLRPCFIAACFSNLSNYQATCANASHVYVTNFTCVRDVREERLSFPSGHSSFIIFSMVFAAMFLSKRLQRRRTRFKLAAPLLQLLFINGGVAVALSRISDYKHHWGDVLGGGVNGLAFAIFTVFCLLKDQETQETILPMKIKRRQGEKVNDDVAYDSPDSLT